jgi:Domain of unknown function (DUF4386)
MPNAGWERLWAGSGVACVVLFGCGLFFADVIAPGYPALDDPPAEIERYFLDNDQEVRALAFFHMVAAVALLFFAAYVRALMRRVEPEGRGLAALALAGGVAAAAFLLLSALLFRTLAEPVVASDDAAQHAILVLSYLAGGPAIAVPLASLIGACSLVSVRRGALPAWIGWLGAAATVFSLASASMLLGPADNNSPLFGLLLMAAGLAFLWVLAASVAMVRRVESVPKFGVAQRGITRSIDQVRAEAKKCLLICANCHAEVEAGVKVVPVELRRAAMSN